MRVQRARVEFSASEARRVGVELVQLRRLLTDAPHPAREAWRSVRARSWCVRAKDTQPREQSKSSKSRVVRGAESRERAGEAQPSISRVGGTAFDEAEAAVRVAERGRSRRGRAEGGGIGERKQM